jgi:adenine-specific DNA-methyltransferase
MAEKFDNLDKEQLINYINDLRRQLNNEKYGLYFDRKATPETIVEECKNKIPLLRRNKNMDISNNGINHLLIEGDNFNVLTSLSLINNSEGIVDVIYIDPPYNTQNKDFVYNDRFVDEEDSFRHTKWLNFMEKRLRLAKPLLKQHGLIFISIDDNEQAQLKLLCDSIFGPQNFVTTFIIDKTAQGANQSSTFKTQHEFLHCYAKNIFEAKINYNFESERDEAKYKFKDNLGWYAVTNSFDSINSPLSSNQNRGYTVYYNETTTDAIVRDEYNRDAKSFGEFDKELIDKGYVAIRPGIRKGIQYPWNWTADRFLRDYKQELVFSQNRDGRLNIYHKNRFTGLVKDTSIKKFDTRKFGNGLLVDILGKKKFDYPKSLDMMKWVVSKIEVQNPVILDFFAGSGTTAQAVLELNKEDGGTRKFILCTNNEGNIMTDVCYPRIKTIISGKREDGSKYSNGVSANVIYFKEDFVDTNSSNDQVKYNLVQEIDSLLCILEESFVEIEQSDKYAIYENNNKTKLTIIFRDFYNKADFSKLESFFKENKRKNITFYQFSTDNVVDENLFKEYENVVVKPIPNKIFEIYKTIVNDIKREY